MKFLCVAAVSSCLWALVSHQTYADVIDIEDFFRSPAYSSVSLSPEGDYITVSIPQGDRTVLAALQVDGMKLVGKWDFGASRHIERVSWLSKDRLVMQIDAEYGGTGVPLPERDAQVSNVDGSRRANLPTGGTLRIVDVLWEDPDFVLVQSIFGQAVLSRMRVRDGELRTVDSVPLSRGAFQIDHNSQVRYATGEDSNLQRLTLRKDGEIWTEVMQAARGTSMFEPLGFTADNQQVYALVSGEGEPAQVRQTDPESSQETLLWHNPNVDPDAFLWSSDRTKLLAVSYTDGLPRHDFLDREHEESKAYLGLIAAFPDHALTFNGISRNGKIILFTAYSDIDPGSVYLFNRETGEARFLLARRDWIDPQQMSAMRPISVTARDGVELHGYITVPRDSEGRNLPMLLYPHGGFPGERARWGYQNEVQFFANRGFAVLQINFRGSGGFGQGFLRRGDKTWGTSRIDDMTDAVRSMIDEGIADESRICTFGTWFGGYAALQAVVREPDLYQCAISRYGTYSLPLFLRQGTGWNNSHTNNSARQMMPESVDEQRRQSPAYNADKLGIPLALISSAPHPRNPQAPQFAALRSALEQAEQTPKLEIIEIDDGRGYLDVSKNVDIYTQLHAFLVAQIGVAAESEER